jgi:hypothetical protein
MMGAEGSALMRAGRMRRSYRLRRPAPARMRTPFRARTPLRVPAPLCLALLVAVGSAVGLSACSHPASGSAAGGRQQCGTSHTSANVPVSVQVHHGAVSCAAAMTVEKAYAQAIDQGEAPGNGRGPVHVSGWTCQYFTTPEQLKTGNVSKCTKPGAEILAVLTAPS